MRNNRKKLKKKVNEEFKNFLDCQTCLNPLNIGMLKTARTRITIQRIAYKYKFAYAIIHKPVNLLLTLPSACDAKKQS